MLVDAEGPFGNPTSDSLRTCITLGTARCLVVAYAPAGFPSARLDGVLDRTATALTQACGGSASLKRQMP
jgi:DNA/RNA-binding domain of Phe-tRNA-synthetase-like protein